MNLWLAASAAYFGYLAVTAAAMRGIRPGGRMRALTCAALGGRGVLAGLSTGNVALRVWVVPPMLLLLAYWGTGALFVAPMEHVERTLQAVDDRLRIRAYAARLPAWLATLLEFAYAGVYPLIPIALGLHLWFGEPSDPDRFWAVVLITDYICFGMLPWLQTRPPRTIERVEPWQSSFRRFNVRLMSTASIRVNTFPSGHAAEALAAALLVLDAPWPWVVWMFFNVAAISAGAVFGRYHYAVDAFTGWAVAVAVWLLT
ncbi:MAG TPA: phosphatase PAP2 family protein [Vicinamibacterales bacterium]|nr:phosphatase PAP2 family protein [Vicinamibacterales bacterium]